jgi:hypothetical protein
MLGADMIGSMFLYETLVKTLFNLGADWVGVYDPQGYNLVPHRSDPQDPWVAQQVDAGYKFLIQTRPQAGAKFTSRAIKVLPLPVHASRVMMAVVPGAYVIAHMSGFESWASDALARKLADAIETWVAESQNPYFPRRPNWLPPPPKFQLDMTRFSNDLSRFRPRV